MSVAVSNWVWEHSEARGNARLVLLAIADCADDTGGNSWPSLTSIAAKARVSRRTAIRAVDELVLLGELERTHGGGRRGQGGTSNGYRVTMVAGSGVSLSPVPEGGSGDNSARSSDTHGTSARTALVPDRAEVVSPATRSGDTGGTRTSLTSKEHVDREPTSKRKTTAPAALEITDRMTEWAVENGIRTDALPDQTERFLDHHRSKGTKFVDWTAAWRTWMGNAKRWSPEITKPAGVDRGPNTAAY